MKRALEPELLDELPAADPRAAAARRDLRLLNALMMNHRPIASFLDGLSGREIRVAEIGAGEGLLSLKLARTLMARGTMFLVDRQPVVSRETIGRIEATGWRVEVVEADIFEWLEQGADVDAICATLFLHHFEGEALRRLLALVAAKAKMFAVAETLRDPVALWFARKLWMIGCNEVTQHDAEISVRAGFRGKELSELWPAGGGWRLEERRHGLFSHFFAAERR